MDSTKQRMILVAVLVCGFAVGMAGLLNYFKYRNTADRIVHERLAFTGNSIELSVQSSLAVGLQLADLGTLPDTLERQRATDDLIVGIDVFDTEGRTLYSTDRLRAKRPAPDGWMAIARKAGDDDWIVHDDRDAGVGMPIKTQFGLTVAYVVLRYSEDRVRDAALAVARALALAAGGTFAGASLLASLALLLVMRGPSRDVQALENALRSPDPTRAAGATRKGPFAAAMARFVGTVRAVEAEIAELRGQLHLGQNGPQTPPGARR